MTVAQLRAALELLPGAARVEVWYPMTGSGQYGEDVDVVVQDLHDNAGDVVALAVIAGRPRCAGRAFGLGEPCTGLADVELLDRTGHRHRVCVGHARGMWDGDRRTKVSAVYGPALAAGWTFAVTALWERWPHEPAVREWTNTPAPWERPLPAQPDVRDGSVL